MMKHYLLPLLVIMAAGMTSCQQKSDINDLAPDSAVHTIKAVLQTESTKTSVSYPDATSAKFSFVVGDNISVFNGSDGTNNHLPVTYTCTNVQDGVATFTTTDTTVDESVDPVIATYPTRSASTGIYEDYGSGTLRIMLPVNQSDAKSSGYTTSAIPFVACASSGDQLSFKQTCGILELTLKGTAKVKSITLDGGSTVIAGACSVNYADAAPSVEMKGTSTTSNYTYSEGVQLTESGVKFYFGLPAGTIPSLTITIRDTDYGYMTKTATNLTTVRGKVIPSTLTYTPDGVSYTDLTAGDTFANCYIVERAGTYRFKAAKPDGTLVSGDSATWVWATSAEWNPDKWPTTYTDATWYNKLMDGVVLKDGYVYFDAAMSTTGNAVLGVLDGSGSLLWSWHIWLTSAPADVTYAGATWMDRNLGAGYKTDVTGNTGPQTNAARGLYYQGGRKDPVIGPHGNGSYNNTAKKHFVSAPEKNGGTALYVYNTAITSLTGWSSPGSNDLNTDVKALNEPLTLVKVASLPNVTADGTPWPDNADPCPAGYCLPTKAQAEAAISAAETASAISLTANGNSGQVNVGDLVFPLVGFRDVGIDGAPRKEGTVNATSSVRLWTKTTNSSSNTIWYWRFDTTYDSTTKIGSYNKKTTGYAGRQNANSVRCVKK